VDDATTAVLREEAGQVRAMLKERAKLEARLRMHPIDTANSLSHMNGELAPSDVQKRLQPMTRYLYTKFLMPDESAYPQISPDLHRHVWRACITAATWCVVSSSYVFLYGICGAVQETKEGEFKCSGNDQDSRTIGSNHSSFLVSCPWLSSALSQSSSAA
jgi:hypothetical protein